MSEKILVVDDEREIADLIKLYLCNEGFTVRCFYAAREALDCVARETLDLAVLDVMLPDTDGF
ncbi:MAG: response regulator, partial [Clostridiales Family XIII bacterium]|nr:response regulator [Clostridiales Family XIII bacterium]